MHNNIDPLEQITTTIVFLVYPQNVQIINQTKIDIMHGGPKNGIPRLSNLSQLSGLHVYLHHLLRKKAILGEFCNNTSAQDI